MAGNLKWDTGPSYWIIAQIFFFFLSIIFKGIKKKKIKNIKSKLNYQKKYQRWKKKRLSEESVRQYEKITWMLMCQLKGTVQGFLLWNINDLK